MNKMAVMLLTLWLVGCAGSVQYHQPEIDPPPEFQASQVLQLLSRDKVEALPDSAWWQGYRDETLNQLLEQALRQHYPLQAASARLSALQAEWQQLQAEQGGQLQGAASARQQSQWQPTRRDAQSLSLEMDATLALDTSGREYYQRQMLHTRIEQQRAQLQQLLLQTSSQLVQDYLQLRYLQQGQQQLQTRRQLLQQQWQIYNGLLQAGLQPALALTDIRLEIARLEVEMAAQQQRLDQQRNQLATLSGQFEWPAKSLSPKYIPEYHWAMPELSPLTVLRTQPQVQQAEARLQQTVAQIGIARSAFYPQLELAASLQLGSNRLALPGSDTLIVGLIARLQQQLFDGGARQAAHKVAIAQAKAAMADYRHTLLQVNQQINDILQVLSASQQQLQAYRQQEQLYTQAEQQIQANVNAGLMNRLQLLDAQLQRVIITQQLQQQQTLQQQTIAQLFGMLAKNPATPEQHEK